MNFDYNGWTEGSPDTSRVIETIEFSDGTQAQLISFVDPGTEGDDFILGSYFEDTINAKGGNDTVTAFESNDTINGGTGNNLIDAGAGDDLIAGGTGDDSLTGGEGYDTYSFNLGDGVDTITDTASLQEANLIRFGEGITQDDISVSVEGTTLTIEYGNQGDAIRLLNFEYNAESGSHVVETLGFADGTYMRLPTLVDPGTEADDIILGSYFEDVINAKAGNDTVTTFESDDTIDGGTGDDTIDAGAGHDLITGGPGADTLTGGLGDDLYRVDDPSDTVIENADEGTDTVESSVTYTLGDKVENLTLTGTAAINATGNDLDNVLTGNSGANTLTGGDGDDDLTGGAGDDLLDGGPGDDTMEGQAGDDVYVVDSTGDAVSESPDEGMDTVWSSVRYTLGANLENLILTGVLAIDGTGNVLDNSLTGNAAANTLTGGMGDDILDAGAGDDRYVYNPGDGHDTVTPDLKDILGPLCGDSYNNGFDTVKLGANPLDLIFSKSWLSLDVSINGTGDRLTILGSHLGSTSQVDAFQASDGSRLVSAKVDLLIQSMASFCADSHMSWSQAIQRKPDDVQQILAQFWQPQ